ncbi:hypothetical protein BTVI_04304 [Pitangus sulphuratus]|nr:hypothetical protein BTVI_04304 [Pitangus sulphuratus]
MPPAPLVEALVAQKPNICHGLGGPVFGKQLLAGGPLQINNRRVVPVTQETCSAFSAAQYVAEGLELQKAEIRALPLPWRGERDMKNEEELKVNKTSYPPEAHLVLKGFPPHLSHLAELQMASNLVLRKNPPADISNGGTDTSPPNKGRKDIFVAQSAVEVVLQQTQRSACVAKLARRSQERENLGMLVWSPNQNLSEAKLDEYIAIAKEKHGYNMEQALGMLFWHKHNIEKSLADLPNFTPFPDEWTVEDKVLFEQAFSFHGKTFHRIQQMLPDKSIASLVKFYYSWKKTRTKTSVMDRHARKQKREREESEDEMEEANGNNPIDIEVEQNKESKKEV